MMSHSSLMTDRKCAGPLVFVALLLVLVVRTSSAFMVVHPPIQSSQKQPPTARIFPTAYARRNVLQQWQLRAVTEEDVISVVEEAEALWAEALEARKKADAAAGKAEAIKSVAAAAAADSDSDSADDEKTVADISHLDAETISMAKMADDIEADVYVKEAEQYSEQADKIEELAEAKLAESEQLLDQHLIDFPDSALQD